MHVKNGNLVRKLLTIPGIAVSMPS